MKHIVRSFPQLFKISFTNYFRKTNFINTVKTGWDGKVNPKVIISNCYHKLHTFTRGNPLRASHADLFRTWPVTSSFSPTSPNHILVPPKTLYCQLRPSIWKDKPWKWPKTFLFYKECCKTLRKVFHIPVWICQYHFLERV